MMSENLKPPLHSAKAIADYHEKNAVDARKKEAASIKKSQLKSEQIALLKESNDLAKRALASAELKSEQERTMNESSGVDLFEIKPNFFGLGANLNEAWRRLKEWYSK